MDIKAYLHIFITIVSVVLLTSTILIAIKTHKYKFKILTIVYIILGLIVAINLIKPYYHWNVEYAPIIKGIYVFLFLMYVFSIMYIISFVPASIVKSLIPKKEYDPTKRLFIKRIYYYSPLFLSLGMSGYATIKKYKPIITKLEIPIKNISNYWKNKKIVHISDLHIGKIIGYETIKEAFDLIESISPDMMFITGDIVNNSNYYLGTLREILEEFKIPPLGIYTILGNHDYIDNIKEFKREIKKLPIELIADSHTILNDELVIAGVEYNFFRKYYKNLEKAFKNLDTRKYPIILLAHHPVVFNYALDFNVDLMLAGHTHGGQIIIGNFALGSLLYERYKGLYKLKNKSLYVNSGLGHWFPIRVNCPPEITVIKIV